MHIGSQNPAHLVRGQMAVIIGEQQPGFLLVAHKAIDLLQKIPALHGNAHVGNGRKNLFVVLFGVVQHLFYSIFFQIQLQRNGIAVGKDLVALFL